MLPAISATPPAVSTATDKRTCYVQNSKNGDVINCIAPLYQKYLETKERQVLMVSKEFSGVLTGCSYIEPVIWDGDWADLAGATKRAAAQFKNVVVLSTYGASLKLEKMTPSFAIEQYRLAGMAEKYGELPLIFDRRNAQREQALIDSVLLRGFSGEQPILFADHSQSSPFPYTDDLVQMLKKEFPHNPVLRLSEVKAEQVYDLLGLYDKAAVLVSIETMHLHLAAASGIPVVALVTERPEMWHGTAWRKQFLVHCRYADYPARRAEVLNAVAMALTTGVAPSFRPPPPRIEITGRHGYNMTSLEWQGKRIGVFRWHPNANQWQTELAGVGADGKVVRIAAPKGFEKQSIEDGRLFIHRDKLHLSYTVARDNGTGKMPTCVVQYGELDTSAEPWRIMNPVQPRYRGNDFTKLEKNWSFISSGGKLFAAYQRSPEQIVLELDGDWVVQELHSKPPAWEWGQIRGGTQPIERNGLSLQFCHSSTRNNKTAWGWVYYLLAILMETTPPFQIVSVSSYPILAGTEEYFPTRRWKPRILFPAGAIKSGDKYILSLGVNDAATARVTLTERDLNL
jgi:predicted GH43/DUF377 family glycosyl hydrolase